MAATALHVGDGLDPGTAMGPLANERRIPALERLIADAMTNGATLVTGGARTGNRGHFFQITRNRLFHV